jgi:hypothetical protein
VSRIFAIVTDPHGHVAIDGSGMLVTATDAKRLEAVGDSFVVDMDSASLGPTPAIRYTVLNTVSLYVPDVEIAWTVGAPGRTPLGHFYGYRLDAIDDSNTEVFSYCDWSGVSQAMRERRPWPTVPASALEQSLANLDRLATNALT